MVRILLGGEDCIDKSSITIKDQRSLDHLSVLRIKKGEVIEALDGRGNIWDFEITEVNRKQLSGRVMSHVFRERSLPYIYLAVALVPFVRFDYIVEKAVEVGVDRLYPIEAERSLVPATRAKGREKRWLRIIKESIKQCGNPYLMEICPVDSLVHTIHSLGRDVGILIPHLADGNREEIIEAGQRLCRSGNKTAIVVCIGPEGDWTKSEVEEATKMGAIPVSLGYNVLRVDTAAIAASWVLCNMRGRYEDNSGKFQ